jgi:hypothetical protein
LPLIPYCSAGLCQSAQNAYGYRWLSTWLTLAFVMTEWLD